MLQALETELGGVQVYERALKCVVNKNLKEEWEKYLDQTHVKIVLRVIERPDPEEETPGRGIVRHIGESLVKAMVMALDAGDPDAAQLVAAECVVLAETKDQPRQVPAESVIGSPLRGFYDAGISGFGLSSESVAGAAEWQTQGTQKRLG